jgi:hypothetical protein
VTATHNLEKRGRGRLAAKIEHRARYLYPATFVVGLVAIMAHGLAGR